MAIAVRCVTVATTVDEIENHFPGGWPAFTQASPGAVRIGRLARLNLPIAGLRCGTWTACKGAYVAELVPHADIALVIGRHRKIGALVHRSVLLRDQPRPLEPIFEPDRPLPPPRVKPNLRSRALPYGAAPWYIGGDHDEARAKRVAIWLHVAKGIGFEDLTVEHLALLPADQFDVTATAVAWEMRTRIGGHASGTPNSAYGKMLSELRDIEETLSAIGVTGPYGAHRWPAEMRNDGETK